MLLLSIRPRFVDLIMTGEKQYELRRRRPRGDYDRALIYATSPRMELVGTFRVASVLRAPPRMLWQLVRDAAGVTRREFDTYFSDLSEGIALQIAEVKEFRDPVPLATIRSCWEGFHPPQGFRYIETNDLRRIGALEPLESVQRTA